MKSNPIWKSLAASGALLVALTAGGCAVHQTEQAKLPDVKVTTTDGNLPKYDVDVADVEVKKENKQVDMPNVDLGTERKTVDVTVPDVDVHKERSNVSVPDVDVTMPSDK
jgi:hypothetical protein